MKLSRYSRPQFADFSDIDRWFDQAFNSIRRHPFAGFHQPALDVAESKDAYEVTVELPGIKKDDVQIEHVKNHLVITAHRQEGEAKTELKRSIRLPDEIQSDHIKAKLEDGILSIHAPKAEEAKPKHIEIE